MEEVEKEQAVEKEAMWMFGREARFVGIDRCMGFV